MIDLYLCSRLDTFHVNFHQQRMHWHCGCRLPRSWQVLWIKERLVHDYFWFCVDLIINTSDITCSFACGIACRTIAFDWVLRGSLVQRYGMQFCGSIVRHLLEYLRRALWFDLSHCNGFCYGSAHYAVHRLGLQEHSSSNPWILHWLMHWVDKKLHKCIKYTVVHSVQCITQVSMCMCNK